MRHTNPSRMLTLATVAAAGLISGCSSVPFFGGDDRQADRAANLEVPPEFTRPTSGGAVALPEIASARAEQMDRRESGGVLDSGADIQVAGEPGSRYLVVAAEPDAVWPKLRDFLREEGYTIRRQEASAGLIETEWTGLASGDQTGFSIMNFLRVAADTLFKPDFIERVRLRIERGDDAGETLVFVTSQKRELTGDEPLMPGDESDTFKYSNAVDDPSMNAETMARLAAYLSGGSAEEARQMVGAKFSPRAKVEGDEPEDRHVVVTQSYPKVWNRLGLALDRLGFDPVSRDRDTGEVEVSHPYPQALYEGILMRGVTIDKDAEMTLHLTLRVEPRRDGGTDVRIRTINVAGGSLPEDRSVVLSRIKSELE
ncbi:outer membrane protein assembly factor BamC [Guyparkeria sp.]|uniref:outer membrane protein assembly factor BamC n=1 Tax=Guyparkeria sp. TaxID=2035736 RepID=UPI0039709B82